MSFNLNITWFARGRKDFSTGSQTDAVDINDDENYDAKVSVDETSFFYKSNYSVTRLGSTRLGREYRFVLLINNNTWLSKDAKFCVQRQLPARKFSVNFREFYQITSFVMVWWMNQRKKNDLNFLRLSSRGLKNPSTNNCQYLKIQWTP